jgi:hypothetical protein
MKPVQTKLGWSASPLLLLLAWLLPAITLAATITSVTDGSYTNAATWNLNRVPAAGDDVVIAGGTSVTVPSGTREFDNLTITSGGTLTILNTATFRGTGAITVAAGGTFNIQASLTFDAPLTNDGTVNWTGGNITAGSTTFTNNNTLSVNLNGGLLRTRLINSGTADFGGGTDLNVTFINSYIGEAGSFLRTSEPKGVNISGRFTLRTGATLGPVFAVGLADPPNEPTSGFTQPVNIGEGATFGTGVGSLGFGEGIVIGGTAQNVTLNFEEIAIGRLLSFTGATFTGNGQTLTIPSGARLQTLSGGDVRGFSSIVVDGILAGQGRYSPDVTINPGGVLNPGLESDPRLPTLPLATDNLGCAEFGGNLTINGTYIVNIRDDTPCQDYDQVELLTNATVDISNASLDVDFAPGATNLDGKQFEIIRADVLAGTFATVDPTLPGSFVVEYDQPTTGSVLLRSTLPLPVELIYFELENRESTVELSWVTATESGNDFFRIERSADGVTFEPIGRINGAGTVYEPRSYTFTDTSPLGGVSYYRLRQQDFDGAFAYSPVRSVTRNGSSQQVVSVFPNPTTDGRAEIHFSPLPRATTLVVRDALGRTVTQQSLAAGSVRSLLDLSRFGKGVYHLSFTSGHSLHTVRLVRN